MPPGWRAEGTIGFDPLCLSNERRRTRIQVDQSHTAHPGFFNRNSLLSSTYPRPRLPGPDATVQSLAVLCVRGDATGRSQSIHAIDHRTESATGKRKEIDQPAAVEAARRRRRDCRCNIYGSYRGQWHHKLRRCKCSCGKAKEGADRMPHVQRAASEV